MFCPQSIWKQNTELLLNSGKYLNAWFTILRFNFYLYDFVLVFVFVGSIVSNLWPVDNWPALCVHNFWSFSLLALANWLNWIYFRGQIFVFHLYFISIGFHSTYSIYFYVREIYICVKIRLLLETVLTSYMSTTFLIVPKTWILSFLYAYILTG